ncbi:cyclophane-forming radical SAM peptide maturase AmcB [Allokutzneria multivorans]|uniref:cyclophane-forming radical SAM peptide maturase AmcB n=1 Tax=Allokutzneria multivorans TaxID=1142134 RepID=UPI0031F1B7B6
MPASIDYSRFVQPSVVVMQPTTLCNLDCAYCYLPARHRALNMLPAVARAVASSVAHWTARRRVEICWHGGEPLTLGRDYLSSLMDAFDGLDVVHSIQTNSTLITPEWSRFLLDRRVRVGVSIDGPRRSNGDRVDRAGRHAYERIHRGIRQLVGDGHEVSAIAVVSDPTPRRARSLYSFVSELGCTWLGVNIEEREGANTRRNSFISDEVVGFWAELFGEWSRQPRVRLREAQRALAYAQGVLNGQKFATSTMDPLPSVAWNGEVTLFSPELVGYSSARLGEFSCGSVLRTSLDELIRRGSRAPWVAEFLRGARRCRVSCDYFDFCGGGTAANRYFETGRMDSTETDYCRNSKKALMEGVLAHVSTIAR